MNIEEKDIEIAKKICEYIELISSSNNNKKIKIDLESLLVNFKQHNIEGLILNLKNDMIKKKLINPKCEDPQNYELKIIKEIFKKIAPTFCQDIIALMLSCELGEKYKQFNEIAIETYFESRHSNFESFFKKIELKKNIIYTFSKMTEDIFDKENIIENKYGNFNKENAIIEIIGSFNDEKNLKSILKSLIEDKSKKLLILKLSENEFYQIKLVRDAIINFQRDNQSLKDKIIILIIYKQRASKGTKTKKEDFDLLSFSNEYYQIFIDNLKGKQKSDIFKIIQTNNEEKIGEYINNSKFFESKIFTIFNYMKYKILDEIISLNVNNYKTKIIQKIIENEKIKDIKDKNQSIKGIIKDIFINDIKEKNIDFLEIADSKINSYLCKEFLNIILNDFKENISNEISNAKHLDTLIQNRYFNNLINNQLEKIKLNFNPPIIMNLNEKEISAYNGLQLPQSKLYFDKLIKYINDEISERYINNENSMRKNYDNEKKNVEITRIYYNESNRLKENVKTEINKYEYYKEIYSQKNNELKRLLLEDYLIYFVIKNFELKDNNYSMSGNIFDFLKLIIKIMLNENHNNNYNFKNSLDEFIKILIFSQGYKKDLKILFNIFVELQKYCENILEYMEKIFNKEIIKYEISERSKKYSKIVNIYFFNIIESFIRAILLFSKELIKKDKVAFYDLFKSFTTTADNLEKINIKYNLNSKGIYNISIIIKIGEECKDNLEKFEENYEKIINNLLQQTILLYDENYNDLYNVILDLNKILDITFTNKSEGYSNLLFYIIRQLYKNIFNENRKIKLLESFFENKLLIQKSKFFFI